MLRQLAFFTVILTMGIGGQAWGHTPPDPNFLQPELFKDWKTLETSHFRIHHESTQAEYAQRMGTVAERVHTKLSKWLSWIPRAKTEVVILDSVDFSNGGASPLPYNRFYIYMPTPVDGQIADHNPWLEMVFTHEYVHILQLDMVHGAPKGMRNIFGRMTNIFTWTAFPQIFAPSWVTEGIATYGESDNPYGYGRLNGAWYEAAMRMEVQRGIRSLTEMSYEGYSGVRWPYGSIYLYGAYFFQFIEERYGRSKVKHYIQIYGGNFIPWRMDSRAHKIFNKSGKAVWAEFQDYLREKFAAQLTAIEEQSASKTRVVFDTPYTNRLLTAADNGDLYYYHNNESSYPSVRRIRADGSSEKLFGFLGVFQLDWQEQAGLLISKLEVCDNTKVFADLYLWKPGMSSPDRLTDCGRYVRMTWKPDGSAIAAVQLDRSLSRLVILNNKGEQPEVISALEQGDTLGHIDWSPDGRYILASVKRKNTGWNLEQFDLENNSWTPLTANGDQEIRPKYSRDGQSIYFISDRDQVWNLRQLDLAGGEIKTLSNTVSGFEEAVEMPDHSYRLVEYTAEGLAITALDDTSEQTLAGLNRYGAKSKQEPQVFSILTSEDYQPYPYQGVDDYSPWGTLMPRSWFPVFSITNDESSFVGVTLSGADVLGFHQWTAVPLYYYDQDALGGIFAYSLNNRLTFSASRELTVSGTEDDPIRYQDDETHLQLLLNHYFNSLYSSIYVAAGVANERIKTEVVKGTGTNFSTQDTITGAILRYNNTEYYRRSISLVDGRIIQLVGESYDLLGESNFSGEAYSVDWNEYLGLGANHVLRLRGLYGGGDDSIRPYQLGGVNETLSTLGGVTGLGRRKYPLRGYPTGLPELTGTFTGLVTAEWRLPLGYIYDGWFVPPLGLGRHSLSLFVDSGDAWDSGEEVEFKTGAGFEWNVETLIGYDLLHIGMTLGYAHGFDEGGEDSVYLRLGLPFL